MKKAISRKTLSAAIAAAAIAGSAAVAFADSCSNTCTTVAIPRTDGVITKLDGTADAALWPPSHELRTIRISALNDQNTACDVTIEDVLQDEKRATTSGGAPIDDAAGCVNDGEASTIQLRSDRAEGGNGRSYHVLVSLSDPSCTSEDKSDEILVEVPIRDGTTDLQPDADVNNLFPSYSGDALACVPQHDPDRLASAQ
jgi:hypothetical protein